MTSSPGSRRTWKAARLARDDDRRDALSLILNALRTSQKELQRPLSDDEELQVLQRERKRRVEAAEAFRKGGREEQAEDEEYELEVLEEFMPEPLSRRSSRRSSTTSSPRSERPAFATWAASWPASCTRCPAAPTALDGEPAREGARLR